MSIELFWVNNASLTCGLRYILIFFSTSVVYRVDFQTNYTNTAGFPISTKLKASFIISSAQLWSLKLSVIFKGQVKWHHKRYIDSKYLEYWIIVT